MKAIKEAIGVDILKIEGFKMTRIIRPVTELSKIKLLCLFIR